MDHTTLCCSGNAVMQILAATYAGQTLIEEIGQILDKSANPFRQAKINVKVKAR